MTVNVETHSTSLVDHPERSSAAHYLHRPKVNISVSERVGRAVMGMAALVAGVLLISAASVVAVALEVLLVVSGLDLLVTGTIGHCPLYQRLGHVPKALGGGA